jgi:hypothetical protein
MVLCSFAELGAPWSTFAAPPAAVVARYVNTDFAYSIHLPDGWTTSASPVDRIVVLEPGAGESARPSVAAVTRQLAGVGADRKRLSGKEETREHKLAHRSVFARMVGLDEEKASRTFVRWRVHHHSGPRIDGALTSYYTLAGRRGNGPTWVKRVAVCSRVRASRLYLFRLQVDYTVPGSVRGNATFSALMASIAFDTDTAPASASPTVAVGHHADPPGAVVRVSVPGAAQPALASSIEAPRPDAAPEASLYDSFRSRSTDMSAADTKALVDSFRVSGTNRTQEEQRRARMFVTQDVMEATDR